MRALALIGLAHAFQADVAVKNLLLQRAIQGQLDVEPSRDVDVLWQLAPLVRRNEDQPSLRLQHALWLGLGVGWDGDMR